MQHIIKKQVFEISSTRRTEMFSIQQAASEFYYTEIVPALEQVFNELAGEDEILSIGRMEIDLGLIQWQQQQKKLSIDQLQDTLRMLIKKQLEKTSADKANDPVIGAPQQTSFKKIPLRLQMAEQWLYYMEKGILPWGLLQITASWQTKVLEAFATSIDHTERLRKMLREHPGTLLRLVQEHDQYFLTQLVAVLTATEQSRLSELTKQLLSVYEIITKQQKEVTSELSKKIHLLIWQWLLHIAATVESGTTTEQLVTKVVTKWLQQFPVSKAQVKEVTTYFPIVATIADSLEPGSETSLSKIKTIPSLDEEATIPVFDLAMIPDEGIFVAHAGLVLIHPFLRFLFKNSGLYREGTFTSTMAREKAVKLVHYLATGSDQGEEHLLTVPKILCGWPLEEPMRQYEQLQAVEKQEADDVLNAAIAQWTILKKTSADGLREGFLQRAGKLHTKNNGIYIQLEKSSIDVLLDHLPWNLSLIKLPWLNILIHVEWR